MVIPWKYGFKSIKSIIKIKFVAEGTADNLESRQLARIRFLFQRESQRRSSALVAGHRAPPGRYFSPQDAHVQRLSRSSCQHVHRHGPEESISEAGSQRALRFSPTNGPSARFFCSASCPSACSSGKRSPANLGPNPVETLQHTTGDWTLRFLVITLCITPFRKLLKVPDLDSLSPVARPLRLFLRLPALSRLPGAGPKFQFSGHGERRLQAPLHHRGFYGLCPSDSFGAHLDRRMDSPSRRTPVANAASLDLYQRGLWCDSLLLAGEIGCVAAIDLRSDRSRCCFCGAWEIG